MKVIIGALLFYGFCSAQNGVPSEHSKNSKTGAVCVGFDFSKALPDTDLYIKIGSLEKKLYSNSSGKTIYDQLDLKTTHYVQVLKGDDPFKTFSLDFKKLKTNFVIIWKAPGEWRMTPLKKGKCINP